jgi:hypothetical protein
VNREVAAALARANLNVQQTLEAMRDGAMPTREAQQSVEALNRLALSLLHSAQQMEHTDGGAGTQQALPQLADLAARQSSVNGRSHALTPLDLPATAVSQQLDKLAAEQLEIAERLAALRDGARGDAPTGMAALVAEAEAIAQQLQRGQLPAELLARQERLFKRLLDAGRTLEKDDYEDQRTGERPGAVEARSAAALDAGIFRDATRFRAPSPEELQALPPAYRRLILDYFERLNRPEAPVTPAQPRR